MTWSSISTTHLFTNDIAELNTPGFSYPPFSAIFTESVSYHRILQHELRLFRMSNVTVKFYIRIFYYSQVLDHGFASEFLRNVLG